MAEELKPCPFCGAVEDSGRWRILLHEMSETAWEVYCLGCGYGLGFEETGDGAIELWNTRVEEAHDDR